MSSFYIYGTGMERAGLLQHEESVQWLENYQSPGEAKVTAQATPDNLAALACGNRIYNPESGTMALINRVQIDQDGTESLITVRANLTAQMLDDRVAMATTKVTGAETGMYAIYIQNRRGLPIEKGAAQGYTEQAGMEIAWGSVLDAEIRLAKASGLGFKVLFDPETGTETFTVYRGFARSDDRSPDYIGYFGTDVGGIESATVTSGMDGYKNVAVVVGADEGAGRTVRTVSLGNLSDDDRRELYVDASDLKREYQVATQVGEDGPQGNPTYSYDSKTYTVEEYNALLDARGFEKLTEHMRTFSVGCEITQDNMAYGVDYGLGDRVHVKLPDYRVSASARISSATRVYERDGNKILVVLDEFEMEEQ